MIQITTEIICENFEQTTIKNNKIYVNEQQEEYYIIPLNKDYDLTYDDEVYKLTFTNQLLWLKYSNKNKYINLKEYNFKECVIIKSKDILDVYVKLFTGNYFIKNVWQSYNVNLKKKYVDDYFLVIPIINDMVKVNEFGVAGNFNQIEVITNEILLKQVKPRSEHGGNIVITNNVNLCKEAVFIRLSEDDVGGFLEEGLNT